MKLTIATALVLLFSNPASAQKVTPEVARRIAANYTECAYADSNARVQNPQRPMIYKLPKYLKCGASFGADTSPSICDNIVKCTGRDISNRPLPDIYFATRCFATNANTCPSAKACRDAVGLESFSASAQNENVFTDEGKSGTTSQ